jgi:hypothetical protein
MILALASRIKSGIRPTGKKAESPINGCKRELPRYTLPAWGHSEPRENLFPKEDFQ